MNLILDYESSALVAPQSFLNAMQTAASILDSTIQNNITVTIQVGYNDWYNNTITGLGASAEGGDLSGSYVSYTSLRAALASNETSTLDQTFVNSLPNTTSVNGVSGMYVPSAIEKALGMISPTASGIDGAVGIGSGIPTADLVGVALHEFTHAMGREPGSGTFDLGRYTSPGVHLFSSGSTAPASYFSIDGGVTKLADYGQNSDPSDTLNSGVQGANDPFNEYYSGSTIQGLTTVDKQQLDALGFNVTPSATGTPSATTSSLVASSPTVTANGASTTTLTVTVKDASGNAVANTTVTLSASGSANNFGAISGTTDANGNFTTTLASTKAQTETITATEGGIQETTSVSFVAGAPSVTTSSIVANAPTVTADGTTTTTLTVTVEDANGNAVAGTAVTLSGSGSANSFGAISGTTNANGVFSTTLASTLVQNETITATEGSVSEHTSVSFVAGGPSAATSSIVASSPTVTANGTSTTTLTVTVEDAQGHAVAGTAVTLSGSGSANSFGAISGTTNASGVFTTTLASTLAQNETITATEGSTQEHTSVSFVAGAPSAITSSLVASSPTVTADGTSTTTLTVTVEDAHGNAEAGTAVTLSGSGSSNAFGAISGTTNASGVFTTTLASTLLQNETITATEGSVQEHTAVSFVPATVSGGFNLKLVGSGDFAAGGNADLAWQNASGVTLWNGSGSALTEVTVPGASMGSEWSAYGVGDFNGDGNADLLWTNNSGQVAIWEMNGANLVGFGVPAGKMGTEWHIAGIGDFNGSGDSDILWVSTAGQAAVWTMSGTALAGFAISNGSMGAAWHVAAIGDFKNDGHSDVLWENTSGQVDIWEMNGAKLSGFVQNVGQMGADWKIAGVGHFNGAADSTSDVVWVNSNTNHVQIWQIQNGEIADIINPSGLNGLEWHPEAVGNFAGDASSDLLWISNSGAASIWEINGASVQAISVSAPTGNTLQLSNSVAAAAAQIEGASTQSVTEPATGALLFNGISSTDKNTVSVSPENGGSGYLGNFTVGALDTANGQESVGWQFNFDSSAVTRTATQTYDVKVTDHSADGTNNTVSQAVSVTIGAPGSDTFVFKPGFGADVIVNPKSSDAIELDGFASAPNIHELQTLLQEAQNGESQSMFQTANGGHDTVINFGNHDSITLLNVKVADLHASNFIIHG